MKTKMWLLSGAALALVAGMAAPAAAEAPKKAAAANSASAQQAAEIEMLKSQVQALTDRLNAQEAAQQQTQAQAAQAQAAVAQVQATQASTDQEIDMLPSKINMAIAEVPKPVKNWSDSTVVSGRMYGNLSNIEQKSNGVKTAPTGTGFDIKRFYVGIDHKFNDMFSANITTDFQYSSAISSTEVYLKKAYLQAKINDNLTIRAGSADLPWVPYAEDIYGYRYVENTLIDRTKFGTSADWGVHALGTLPGGVFSYAVAIIDGAGYKAPLRSKGMDLEGRLSAKVDKFNFAIGGYSGKLGKDIEAAPATFHKASRVNAIAAYIDPKFRVGVEYFDAKNWNNVTTAATDEANGYSVFGAFNFTDKIGAFGRYDWVKPNKDTASTKKDGYYNFGVQWEPTKIVDLSLVYKHDSVEHGTLATSNGTIGGSNKGIYNEIGLFGQLRW